MNKDKLFYYGATTIGLIALFGSFSTIFQTLKNSGGDVLFALEVPITVDILIIFLSFAVIYLIHLGKKRQALFFKMASYVLMLGSLYLNISKSLENINILFIIGHSVIVLAWILCVEFLIIRAKDIYTSELIKKSYQEEIINLEHRNRLELLNIQHNKEKDKILQNTAEIKIKKHREELQNIKFKHELKELTEKENNIKDNNEYRDINKNDSLKIDDSKVIRRITNKKINKVLFE